MKLSDIRGEIDRIDAEIVPLLKKRMECSLKVAEIKKTENLPVYHPQREQEILDSVNEAGGDFGKYITAVYRELMSVSREAQHEMLLENDSVAESIEKAKTAMSKNVTVACQGTYGAFSNIAAENLHKGSAIKFYPSFEEVFEAVKNDEADYGVVPVENSNAGSVIEVYDLILKYRFYIVSAAELEVNENLLGLKGARAEDIKTVYSHPQALAQSDEFIKSRGITAVSYTNTAMAAEYVSKNNDKTVGAIGSRLAARLYGLDVIESRIQNVKNNRTRFITISKELIIPEDANKVSVVFSLPHTVGALRRALDRFAVNGLNLTKIESRAARTGNFEYLFYLDFSGNLKDDSTVKFISSLKGELPEFTFLGNYNESHIKE